MSWRISAGAPLRCCRQPPEEARQESSRDRRDPRGIARRPRTPQIADSRLRGRHGDERPRVPFVGCGAEFPGSFRYLSGLSPTSSLILRPHGGRLSYGAQAGRADARRRPHAPRRLPRTRRRPTDAAAAARQAAGPPVRSSGGIDPHVPGRPVHRRGGQRRGLRERRASFQPQPTNLRAGAWQVGPAFGAIYKGIPGILLGGLLQNPISFAYTSSDRRPLSTLLVQPILLKHLWRGLYVKSADATWTIGERAGSGTTLPLSFGLGYVIPREGSPPINVFVSGQWMAYRQDAPVAPQTTVRFGMTIAFPEWTRWKGF